jgi:ribonuclease-3
MIYCKFPSLLEGEMTKIKSSAVSRQSCAEMSRSLGIDQMLRLGKGMQNGGDLPSSLAAAVLESIIAAIYLDGGFEAARNFLRPLVEPLIDAAADSGHQQNYKSLLQQHAQQALAATPVYRVLDEKGPDHAKCFKISVEINGQRYTPSWGQSKKRAEQIAALNALREMGVLYEDEHGRLRQVGGAIVNGSIDLPDEMK